MFNHKSFAALVLAAGFIVAGNRVAARTPGSFGKQPSRVAVIPEHPQHMWISAPVPSPDGKLLIWEQSGPRTEFDPNFTQRITIADSRKPLSLETVKRVFTRTKSQTVIRRLTRPDEDALSPAFSPDGKWVTFLSARGENAKQRIFALSLSGGEAEPLTSHSVDVFSYQWGSDGSIAFTAESEAQHLSIYIRHPDGREELLVQGTQAGGPRSVDAAATPDSASPSPALLYGFEMALSHDASRLAYRKRFRNNHPSTSPSPHGVSSPPANDDHLVEDSINIIDRETRQTRAVRIHLSRDFTGNPANLRWSWDDGELYYLGAPAAGARSTDRAIYRLNPETGEAPAEPVTKRFRGDVKEFETCAESDRIFALGIERLESAGTKETRDAWVALRIRPREGTHEALFEIEGGAGASAQDLATNANGEKLYFVLPRMKQSSAGTNAAIASWTFPDETYSILFPTAEDSTSAEDAAPKDEPGDPSLPPQREESP